MVYTLRFFSLQNAVCFIILTYLVSVLFSFCIQDVLKLKKNNSGAKRLIIKVTLELHFRGVRKIAKSDYLHRHVCPSVRTGQLGFHWMAVDES